MRGRSQELNAAVGEHLRQLREVHLVRGQSDGPRRIYTVNPSMIARLRALVGALEDLD